MFTAKQGTRVNEGAWLKALIQDLLNIIGPLMQTVHDLKGQLESLNTGCLMKFDKLKGIVLHERSLHEEKLDQLRGKYEELMNSQTEKSSLSLRKMESENVAQRKCMEVLLKSAEDFRSKYDELLSMSEGMKNKIKSQAAEINSLNQQLGEANVEMELLQEEKEHRKKEYFELREEKFDLMRRLSRLQSCPARSETPVQSGSGFTGTSRQTSPRDDHVSPHHREQMHPSFSDTNLRNGIASTGGHRDDNNNPPGGRAPPPLGDMKCLYCSCECSSIESLLRHTSFCSKH